MRCSKFKEAQSKKETPNTQLCSYIPLRIFFTGTEHIEIYERAIKRRKIYYAYYCDCLPSYTLWYPYKIQTGQLSCNALPVQCYNVLRLYFITKQINQCLECLQIHPWIYPCPLVKYFEQPCVSCIPSSWNIWRGWFAEASDENAFHRFNARMKLSYCNQHSSNIPCSAMEWTQSTTPWGSVIFGRTKIQIFKEIDHQFYQFSGRNCCYCCIS